MAQGNYGTLLRTWSKHFGRAGLNWAIRCSYHSEHSANRLTASWQNVLHVSLRERERARQRQKRRVFRGGGDALGDFASVLCTAIVHQSLLEAKLVRTEQRFPRDLSLSAGMPQRKFNPKAGSDGWTDTLNYHLHRAFEAGQFRETVISVLSCITAKVQIKVHDIDINFWLHCTITNFNKNIF